ncbi:MAG: peptidase M48 [Bacteroidetes bacterium GWF2_42_66]|nr:MAG: peptidase M48 [Bacteroidetes bacterium GWA2_42_15]OFY02154.1 MAG: peptidase M48 [Bacteroidetes bacterium GWE2_42_39]OFY43600.1 MAG: peptidase M48 [Bacteroidetes bacterium GWF2_42_66]HBL75230.1 peptidase M48 [Prolixibacteraceae bacterium]HCU59690.1 peptidase M48 [Prolixibacteraceae bacterium]
MEQILFYLIIGLLLVDFIFERFLDYLNTTRWSETLPDEVKGIYDEEKYRKQQAYEKTNHRFSMLTGSFSFVLIMLMFLFYGFAWVDQMAHGISGNPIVVALVFFGILMLASDLLNTPFSIYDVFSIEERFGFNKMTPKTFVLDKLKGWLLGALIGGGILALVVFIYLRTTDLFWVYVWLVISGFSIFMAMFYSNLIVPLFNKQTPLEEGDLKQAINNFAEKAGFKLDNIFVIDGSKRSTKANAYFTGLGTKKRIVLYDTLIADLETDELVAVLAHEIGHYKKKHIVSSLLLGILQTGLMLYVFSLLVGSPALSGALGVAAPSFHIGLVAFGVLYSPLSAIIGLGMNILSRKNEYQADAFAAEYFNAESLASALKKLSVKNLSNLLPHPAYVFFHYSHPTLLQRLAALNRKK